jgi:hypothetical protein
MQKFNLCEHLGQSTFLLIKFSKISNDKIKALKNLLKFFFNQNVNNY